MFSRSSGGCSTFGTRVQPRDVPPMEVLLRRRHRRTPLTLTKTLETPACRSTPPAEDAQFAHDASKQTSSRRLDCRMCTDTSCLGLWRGNLESRSKRKGGSNAISFPFSDQVRKKKQN